MNYSLPIENQDVNGTKMDLLETNENDVYVLAKSYFDLKEYDRTAYFLKRCLTPKAKFLYFYSIYLAAEKKKVDNMTDVPPDPLRNNSLKMLSNEMKKERNKGNLDGYCLYLYGVILKKLQLTKEAINVLVESIHKQPLHWGSWLELAALIMDREKLDSLVLPDHWMKYFFMAHMYLELQLIDEGLALYCDIQAMGFRKNGYVLAQTAIAVHHRRGNYASSVRVNTGLLYKYIYLEIVI